MKRLFLLVIAAITAFGVQGQDVKSIKKLVDAKDFVKAKEAVDQFLASEKGAKDLEALILKAKIYNTLATQDATKSLVPDGRMQAFEAIKKAMEVNNTLTTFMLAQEKYTPIFSLYEGYYGEGANYFNAEKFEDALNSYKNANEVGQYINKNGWALSALDTTLVFMIGASANNAKKLDDAATYYAKLADAHVANKDYASAYKFLIYYYNEKKDDEAFHKYLDLGRKAYPNDKYFDEAEIEYLEKKGDKAAVLKKYEDMLAKDPNDYENTFYYGVSIFNMLYRGDEKIDNRDELIGKLEKAFIKCIQLKPGESEAYLELGKSHYNQAVDFKDKADQIKPPAGKALTPDQQKTKNEIKANAEKKINDAIPYLEKAYNIMDAIADKKTGQKAKERSVAILLRDAYNFINKADKAKFYEDALDKLK